ncbi:MAG: hypothetical protein ACRC9L_01650 [Brevinema sp.]
MKKQALFLMSILPILLFGQTLEQQLQQAIRAGVLPPDRGGLPALAPQQATDSSIPFGLLAALRPTSSIEEVKMGSLSTYFPQGYGREPLHYGIWNAIPFVIFNNDSMDLRFGLIFEHRQVGFIPDDWISTTLSGSNLPNVSFLIPKTKTFLNFVNGTSQWRSTVLLTDAQIRSLNSYTNAPQANATTPLSYTVTHRFIDGSTRVYLIGDRQREFFVSMLEFYHNIASNNNVKAFKGSNAFPARGFFDEIVLAEVTNIELDISTSIVSNPAADVGGYEDYGDGYGDAYGDAGGGYDDAYGDAGGGGYDGYDGY